MFEREARFYIRKKKLFQQMVTAKLDVEMLKNAYIPMHKTQVQMIKDLSIKSATMNLIGEKVGSTLEYIDTGDHSLNIRLVVHSLRSTNNKRNILKLKTSVSERSQSIRQNIQIGKKIFTNSTSDRGLKSKK